MYQIQGLRAINHQRLSTPNLRETSNSLREAKMKMDVRTKAKWDRGINGDARASSEVMQRDHSLQSKTNHHEQQMPFDYTLPYSTDTLLAERKRPMFAGLWGSSPRAVAADELNRTSRVITADTFTHALTLMIWEPTTRVCPLIHQLVLMQKLGPHLKAPARRTIAHQQPDKLEGVRRDGTSRVQSSVIQ
ncbi:hypothetical protein PENSPDRAFT_669300 [Peniophora sp. CONT]|nr:hypothetical protein PENSPDRAFT_669300 [Peniophora sp. CONT]